MPESNQSNISPLEHLPPQNLEAEQSVLGSLLINKDAIVKIADKLSSFDFYRDVHGSIFQCMLELYENREPIDILSLTNKLEEKNLLEKIGGRTYLATLANAVPTAAHIITYAEIVRKKATLRRLINAATEITTLGYKEEVEDVSQLLDQAEQKLFSVSQHFLKNVFIPISSVLGEAFERIDELHKQSGQLRGLPTGFYDLDNILAGLQKSDLIIIAARPSMGKTSLVLDIARQTATKHKATVGLFSLEMSKEQLVDRLLCAEADVDLWKMRTGRLSNRENDDDFPRIGHAMGALSEANIYIDDSATANVMELRTKARRLQAEAGLNLIIIDYLQLMEGRSQENRVQEIAEITRSLKGLARELNIPVIALSQLSRAVEQRPNAIPKLSDLRESGSIEQDADVVLFIYREEMYKRDSSRKGIADIIVAKHRNGPTGLVNLYFDETKASFKNLETKIAPSPIDM